MAEYPYLPLFVTDYVAATDHLSDAEHGIYLKLLMLMWQSPDCRLPDDDDWLARRFRRDANAVRTHMRPIIQEFCQTQSGWITQKRLREEWQWRKTKSQNSSKAANLRWDKEKDLCERSASVHSERNAPTLPYPTPPQETESNEVSTRLRAPKNTGTRLSDNWSPDLEGYRFAIEALGSRDIAQKEFEKFRDYWSSKAGSGARKTDWSATWRNWIRNSDRGKPNGKHRQSLGDIARGLADEARELERAAGIGGTPAIIGSD